MMGNIKIKTAERPRRKVSLDTNDLAVPILQKVLSLFTGFKMGAFEFIEGKVPPGFGLDFEPALFNLEKHRLLQSADEWLCFHLVRHDKKKVVASVFFSLRQGVALSPASAPFGGIECSDQLPVEALYQFVGQYEMALRKKKVKCIQLKLYPSLYHPSLHDAIAVLLFNHGYQILLAELGACLEVDNKPLSTRFDQWEKRRLKQAANAKLEFKVLPIVSMDQVYHFILHCRSQRGHSLSMDFHSLQKTVTGLKNKFFSFGIYHDQELIAASIAIHVSSKVLYNFYSAHEKKYDDISPVVLLIHEMHNWCYQRGFELLDLGTSALGGRPNFSLIDFKLRLGAKPAMKLTVEKKLN